MSLRTILLLPFLMLGVASCSGENGGNGRPILLITIDTLRADHLGCYGYFRDTSPHIDALADESLVFENAFTTMPTTLPAHLSLLTSSHPRSHGVTQNGLIFEPLPERRSFASILGDAGYRTAAIVSSGVLHSQHGIGSGFAEYDHPPKGKGQQRKAGETTAIALDWLATLEPGSPWFLWVHYFDPHLSYSPPEPFDVFRATPELDAFLESKAIRATGESRDAHNRYDGEILYTDSEVGRLLSRLEELGLYDETTIVVTSDHGEGLYQHGHLQHGEIHNEQLLVPLILKPAASSGHRPARVERVASLIDVVPTLAGLVSLDLPETFADQIQGVDLLGSDTPGRHVHAERNHRGAIRKLAVIDRDWKYVQGAGKAEALFRLDRDENELSNVVQRHPEVLGRKRERLDAFLQEHESGQAPRAIDDPQLLEELRALGYIE